MNEQLPIISEPKKSVEKLVETDLTNGVEENKSDTEVVAEHEPNEVHVKKHKNDRNRRKDDKSVDHVQKTLSNGTNNDDKFSAMSKKYAASIEENKKLQLQLKQYEKKVVAFQREKEQRQAEHSKIVLTKNRLESLCRELQKQNKQIKDESMQRVKEEEEKRKAVSGKFQTTLSEIKLLMLQNDENNSKLRDQNVEMQNEYLALYEEFKLREKQIEKMSEQIKLESQLGEAKLSKLKMETVAEKEILENEKKHLLLELASCQHRCQELQKTEATLNSQIAMYNEKYDKFQDALSKSNQLYSSFKDEVGKMSKKIAKLEKETSVWKMKWESNHKALVQVAGEKQQLSKQLTQLQKLCRTLQADRTSLLSQLKSEGIEPKLSGTTSNLTESPASENVDKSRTENIPPLDVVESNKVDVLKKEEVNADTDKEEEPKDCDDSVSENTLVNGNIIMEAGDGDGRANGDNKEKKEKLDGNSK